GLLWKDGVEKCGIGGRGGRSGSSVTRGSIFCEVEILTTASITCSATSAMFSGPRAAAGCAAVKASAAASAAVGIKRVGTARSNKRVEKRCKLNGSNGMEAGAAGRTRHWKGRFGRVLLWRLGRKTAAGRRTNARDQLGFGLGRNSDCLR